MFDMTVPVTDEIKDKYPLYCYYHKHGLKNLHWWAAVMGCDISENEYGFRGAGRKAFLNALASFDSANAPPMGTKLFANALREYSKAEVRLSDSVSQIQSWRKLPIGSLKAEPTMTARGLSCLCQGELSSNQL